MSKKTTKNKKNIEKCKYEAYNVKIAGLGKSGNRISFFIIGLQDKDIIC